MCYLRETIPHQNASFATSKDSRQGAENHRPLAPSLLVESVEILSCKGSFPSCKTSRQMPEISRRFSKPVTLSLPFENQCIGHDSQNCKKSFLGI